jgi:hypothetical protein
MPLEVKFKVNELTNELMHHGVDGMHWGERRYQPYGKGGYNPEHVGHFIGKKVRNRDSRKLYLSLIKSTKRYEDYDMAYNRIKTKKALEKTVDRRVNIDKMRDDARSKQHDYEFEMYKQKNTQPTSKKDLDNRKKVAQRKYREFVKENAKVMGEYRQYADDLLGKYAYRKIGRFEGHTWNNRTAKEILTDVLSGRYYPDQN